MKVFYKGKSVCSVGKNKILEGKTSKYITIAKYKFNSSINTLFSEVNDGFTYTHTDIDNGDGTITRTIYSNQLPTIIRFEDCEGLLEVNYLNTSELTTLRKAFKNCYNVTSINATNWNTSRVTDMSEMFYACGSLTTLDLSDWDTSKVEDMHWMFGYYENGDETMALTSIIGLENWDTSNVTNMICMFCNCRNLTSLDLSDWDTSNVTDMYGMFYNCYKLTSLDVSNFNTSKVTDMGWMFYNCESLTSLDSSDWDVSKVIDMSYMFYFCYDLEHLDVFSWDVSNVTDMSYMFYCCGSLSELDFSRWNVSNVINMELLFCNCCSFSQNTINGLRNWDVSNVEYMSAMIDCLCLNDVITIDLSDWNVSNVIDMSYMLEYNAELKYLNLNNWILNENVDTTKLLLESNNLEEVSIMNSNAFTVNKIIAELPTRTSDSIGVLNIAGINDYTQVDTTTAQSKYWNVINE